MTTENQGESTNQGHPKKEVHVYCIWQCNIVVVSLRVKCFFTILFVKFMFFQMACS